MATSPHRAYRLVKPRISNLPTPFIPKFILCRSVCIDIASPKLSHRFQLSSVVIGLYGLVSVIPVVSAVEYSTVLSSALLFTSRTTDHGPWDHRTFKELAIISRRKAARLSVVKIIHFFCCPHRRACTIMKEARYSQSITLSEGPGGHRNLHPVIDTTCQTRTI